MMASKQYSIDLQDSASPWWDDPEAYTMMTLEQAQIWEFLKDNCIGSDRAMTREAISEALGYNMTWARKIINQLRAEPFNKIIGATANKKNKPKGYYIVVSDEDRDLAVQQLKRHCIGGLVRCAQWSRVDFRSFATDAIRDHLVENYES